MSQVDSEKQKADFLTKPLPETAFIPIRDEFLTKGEKRY